MHRSVAPGTTMEVDFGESWVDIAGVPCKVKYLVATPPYSNAYFAKAYPVERLESLLDGIESAFLYYGGIVERVVLDNTFLAVKDVLAGRDRVQTEAFEGFRGTYPFRAEKDSVEKRRQIRPEPGVPAAAGGQELGGAQRGDPRRVGGRPADAPSRRRALGGGNVDAGAAAPAGDARASCRHLPRRRAGGRQVRTRAGGQSHLLGADPPRLPAGVGEAVSRPGGDRRRGRGGRTASPCVLPGREGPRSVPRAAVAGARAEDKLGVGDRNDHPVRHNARFCRNSSAASRSPVSRTARYSFMGTRGGSGHAALPCISARFVSVPVGTLIWAAPHWPGDHDMRSGRFVRCKDCDRLFTDALQTAIEKARELEHAANHGLQRRVVAPGLPTPRRRGRSRADRTRRARARVPRVRPARGRRGGKTPARGPIRRLPSSIRKDRTAQPPRREPAHRETDFSGWRP